MEFRHAKYTLIILREYSLKPNQLRESQRRWLRKKAMGPDFNCRSDDIAKMIDDLIPIYTTQAILERLTS